MNRFFAGLCLLVSGVCFYIASGSADDTGARLLQEAGPNVFVLTPHGSHTSGGTGFVVRAPSGARYTITNGHVCDMAIAGMMDAQVTPDRYASVRVIEQAPNADLCLTTVVPGTIGALTLASQPATHVYVVGHPHLLPNVLSEGYVIAEQQIQMAVPEHLPCEGPTWSLAPGMGEPMCIRTLDAIQTSAVIYPGNSGSPAMDASGHVIGVMFAGSEITHYGVMVSLEQLREFLARY